MQVTFAMPQSEVNVTRSSAFCSVCHEIEVGGMVGPPGFMLAVDLTILETRLLKNER
jgi:hypothetical protein